MKKIEEAEKVELERRQKQSQKLKVEKEKKRKQLEEARKQKEEELEKVRLLEEEEQKKQQLEQKRKNKEFLKMQNQKLKEKFEMSKKEREDIENRQKELDEKEKQKQKKMKEEMEGFLSKNKDTRMLELKERKEIHKFYKSIEVQELMQLYDEQLLNMYKYYTLQGNISIGGNLEKRMNVIEFNNWVKFGNNTNITPHLISTDDMVAIYRMLEREMDASMPREELDEEINYIEFEHFKKGLIRITILTKTQSISKEIKHRQRRRKATKKGTEEVEKEIEANKKKNQRLKELEQQIAQVESLQKIKVEEKRVSKEFDVSLINVDDVERLLKFLQLDPNDDKYTADKKLTNKSGYPKTIVFEGLECNYSDIHSVRDHSSSYRQKRNSSHEEEKYSVIHDKTKPTKKDEPEVKLQEKNEEENVKAKQSAKPADQVDRKESISKVVNPKKKDQKEESDKAEEKPKELVAVSEEELNSQPQDKSAIENIIAPEGQKEQWKVDEDN